MQPRAPSTALADSAIAQGSLCEPLYQFPVTSTQQAFWLLDRLEPGNPAWNIAVRFEIVGPLDHELLVRAIQAVVHRHEILRTSFLFGEIEPEQIVHASAVIPLPVDDLRGVPAGRRDAEEERLTIEEAQRPFSLRKGPLLRTRLLWLAHDRHMLLLTVHHIVADGWSIGILSDEIAAHYALLAGQPLGPIPELPLQFADYAVWHRERCAPPLLQKQTEYWKRQLAALPLCEIPPDYPRPPVKSHNGYILSRVLPRDLTRRLLDYARQQDSTLYTLALAALQVFIARAAGQQDVYIGTMFAERDRLEFEKLVGVFVNTLVLRSNADPALPFPSFLRNVQRTVDEAIANSQLPFADLVAALRPPNDRSRYTLYNINFIYQRDFVKPLSFAGLTMTPIPSKSPGAIYDLNFFMVDRADGWRLSCEYDRELYAPESVQGMLDGVQFLFEQIAADPQRKLSDFDIGVQSPTPLPPFVPGRASAQTATRPSVEEQKDHPTRQGLWKKLTEWS